MSGDVFSGGAGHALQGHGLYRLGGAGSDLLGSGGTARADARPDRTGGQDTGPPRLWQPSLLWRRQPEHRRPGHSHDADGPHPEFRQEKRCGRGRSGPDHRRPCPRHCTAGLAACGHARHRFRHAGRLRSDGCAWQEPPCGGLFRPACAVRDAAPGRQARHRHAETQQGAVSRHHGRFGPDRRDRADETAAQALPPRHRAGGQGTPDRVFRGFHPTA